MLTPLKEAVRVTLVVEATENVVTVKDPEVEPAGTVTLGGTVATKVLPLASVTTRPPERALPFNVAVAVTG